MTMARSQGTAPHAGVENREEGCSQPCSQSQVRAGQRVQYLRMARQLDHRPNLTSKSQSNKGSQRRQGGRRLRYPLWREPIESLLRIECEKKTDVQVDATLAFSQMRHKGAPSSHISITHRFIPKIIDPLLYCDSTVTVFAIFCE